MAYDANWPAHNENSCPLPGWIHRGQSAPSVTTSRSLVENVEMATGRTTALAVLRLVNMGLTRCAIKAVRGNSST